MEVQYGDGVTTEPGFAPGAFTTTEGVVVQASVDATATSQPTNALQACVQAWDSYHSLVVNHAGRSSIYLRSIAGNWKGWDRSR